MIIVCLTDEYGGYGHYRPAREISFEWRADNGPLYYIYKKGQDESAHMCRPIIAFATLIYT